MVRSGKSALATTVIAGAIQEDEVVQREIFGPIVTVTRSPWATSYVAEQALISRRD